MPSTTWYYIGPDKTGFSCSTCCAGFHSESGSCVPYPCPSSPSAFRNYYCPNSSNPTPDHVYKWNGDPDSSVTIGVNPVLCPGSSTTCYSYTPTSGLNSAGRIGGGACGVSQSYVTPIYNCDYIYSACPGCGTDGCCDIVGTRGVERYCSTTSSGCHCASGSSFNTCDCVCNFQYTDPDSPCYLDPGSGGNPETCYKDCPNGLQLSYTCGTTPPDCPCTEEQPSCPPCYSLVCQDGNWTCVAYSCGAPCPAPGYSCSCGVCSCTSSTTCCTDYSRGWSFNSTAEPKCIPCYYGWEAIQPADCCDVSWKRKNCASGSICCRDGRCYAENTVLCDFNPPVI